MTYILGAKSTISLRWPAPSVTGPGRRVFGLGPGFLDLIVRAGYPVERLRDALAELEESGLGVGRESQSRFVAAILHRGCVPWLRRLERPTVLSDTERLGQADVNRQRDMISSTRGVRRRRRDRRHRCLQRDQRMVDVRGFLCAVRFAQSVLPGRRGMSRDHSSRRLSTVRHHGGVAQSQLVAQSVHLFAARVASEWVDIQVADDD